MNTFFILQISLVDFNSHASVSISIRFTISWSWCFGFSCLYPVYFFYLPFLGSFWRLQAVRTRPWIGSWGGEGIPGDQDHHHRSETEEFINFIMCSCPFSFLVFSMYDYTNRLYTVIYIYYLILVFLFSVIACAKILYFELYWPTLQIKIMLFSWIFYGTETIYLCYKNYISDAKLENADWTLLLLRVLRVPGQGDNFRAKWLQDFQILQVKLQIVFIIFLAG